MEKNTKKTGVKVDKVTMDKRSAEEALDENVVPLTGEKSLLTPSLSPHMLVRFLSMKCNHGIPDPESLPGLSVLGNPDVLSVDLDPEASVLGGEEFHDMGKNSFLKVVDAMTESYGEPPFPQTPFDETIPAVAAFGGVLLPLKEEIMDERDANNFLVIGRRLASVIQMLERMQQCGSVTAALDLQRRSKKFMNLDSLGAMVKFFDARLSCDCLKQHKLQYENEDSGWCQSCYHTKKNSELLRCSGCRRAKYCSPECQLDAWKTHKSFCKAESARRAEKAANKSDPKKKPPLAQMKVRHLKQELLEEYGIDPNQFLEKHELVGALEQARGNEKASAKSDP